MLIGGHRYRHGYFLGRLLSFSLAGWFAGQVGAVAQHWLYLYQIPALASLLLAFIFGLAGLSLLTPFTLPSLSIGGRWIGRLQGRLSLLMMRDHPLPLFLFGFFTIALPCGQTLLVYAACALEGDPWIGAMNGFAFALFTTPSLWAAMGMRRFFASRRAQANRIIGAAALLVALLCLGRALADLEIIPHLILNPGAPSRLHLVLF